MNWPTAVTMLLPMPLSASNCWEAQALTLSKMPWLFSASVMLLPPGIISIAPRRMFPALRSTLALVIGLKPMITVSIVKPGIAAALPANHSRGLGRLGNSKRWTSGLVCEETVTSGLRRAVRGAILRRRPLLNRVRQFVRDQFLAFGCLGLE